MSNVVCYIILGIFVKYFSDFFIFCFYFGAHVYVFILVCCFKFDVQDNRQIHRDAHGICLSVLIVFLMLKFYFIDVIYVLLFVKILLMYFGRWLRVFLKFIAKKGNFLVCRRHCEWIYCSGFVSMLWTCMRNVRACHFIFIVLN